MSSRKPIQLIPLCIALALIFGCTIHYVPKQYPVKEGATPVFTSSRPVNVDNALQGYSKEVIIGVNNDSTWVGDLQEYTETAADLLKSELVKKGIQISSAAQKTLRLEVIKAANFFSGFTCKTNIVLKAETGKGYIREYHVINSSGVYTRSIDGAITKAVTALLNDKQIIHYLK